MISLLSAFNGQAGAGIITALVKEYIKQNRRVSIAKDLNEKTFRNTLYRLHRDKLIKNNGFGIWQITQKGKILVENFKPRPNYPDVKKNPKQNLIIVFDVPQKQKEKRSLLRIELGCLDFKPLQKSVWMGNGPLPEEFIHYLKDLKILDFIHIFEIKSFGTIK